MEMFSASQAENLRKCWRGFCTFNSILSKPHFSTLPGTNCFNIANTPHYIVFDIWLSRFMVEPVTVK